MSLNERLMQFFERFCSEDVKLVAESILQDISSSSQHESLEALKRLADKENDWSIIETLRGQGWNVACQEGIFAIRFGPGDARLVTAPTLSEAILYSVQAVDDLDQELKDKVALYLSSQQWLWEEPEKRGGPFVDDGKRR